MPTEQPATSDPRGRLAAERTLLAWIRTGLSLMAFGFVVARFGLFLREMAAIQPHVPAYQNSASQWIGVVLVVFGTSVLIYAAADHRVVLKAINRGEALPAGRDWAGVVLAALLAILGILVAGYLSLVSP